MKLGGFSVSLSVKDIQASRAFYEQLGFTVYHGVQEQGWLIMKNGETNIGLFQGMFEGNLLTFNPGWDQHAQPVEDYTDAREIQGQLRKAGIEILNPSDSDGNGSGPANFSVMDPDGNIILFDQHV